jgi:hypothetical protein
LRQAILDANGNPGYDAIDFQVGSGVVVIQPRSRLPEITDPVLIDGTTQPGLAARRWSSWTAPWPAPGMASSGSISPPGPVL